MRESLRLLSAFLGGLLLAKRLFASSAEAAAALRPAEPAPPAPSTTAEGISGLEPTAEGARDSTSAGAPVRAAEDREQPVTEGDVLCAHQAPPTSEARLAWPVALSLCIIAGLVALLLLPRELERPDLVPVDLGATANHSRVYLFGVSGDSSSRATLSWTSDKANHIDFFAAIESPVADSVLVFAGPITQTITDCTLDGEPTELHVGPPDAQFAGLMELQAIAAYPDADVLHLQMRTSVGPTSPFVSCSVGDGLSSSAPPSHAVYTPELVVAVEGSPKGISEASRNICIERSVADYTNERVCAEESGTASVADELVELERPRDQWQRDVKLTVLGLLLGLMAQGVWDLLSRVRRPQGSKGRFLQ